MQQKVIARVYIHILSLGSINVSLQRIVALFLYLIQCILYGIVENYIAKASLFNVWATWPLLINYFL